MSTTRPSISIRISPVLRELLQLGLLLYGSITKACLHLLHLDDIWIPTIGRLISIVFALIAGAIYGKTTRNFVNTGTLARGPVALAWCIAACSPLVGFWRSPSGPTWARSHLRDKAAGLYVILCYLKQDERLIVLAALLFYVAWSFTVFDHHADWICPRPCCLSIGGRSSP